ncbi:CheY-like protein [Aspergillus steynii IBT 23096]|uniref:CheY-like protein n=1 Tax=Aspergillus steynii IBT 23096 TaxID=1392250 RepID=A0A2I2GM18_9EURO|nr:CheY-like protein [Aspergillus steynii IBT 23096]PLB53922.1 CheY-like protein [Aspergillus steynii IBT 23096]
MHVLLAEDNDVNQRLCKKWFHRIGCSYAIVNNGREALEYLTSPPEMCQPPDLILMDVSMPVISGIEATAIIRNELPITHDHKFRSIPIIGLAAHMGMAVSRYPLIAVGMNDVLPKPIRLGPLTQLLLQYSRFEPVPVGPGASQARMAPAWGPMPMRRFPGPKSRL